MSRRIPFSEYMQAALYGPPGYYMTDRTRFGRYGDFYTSAQVTSLFGELWAAFILSQAENRQDPIKIVEFGCGNGDLADSLVRALLAGTAGSEREIRYLGIDVSAVARERTLARLEMISKDLSLHDGGRLRCKAASLKDLTSAECAAMSGCFVLGNELLDALPCEVVRLGVDGWEQLFMQVPGLDLDEAGLTELNGNGSLMPEFLPVVDQRVLDYIDRYLAGVFRDHGLNGVIAEAQVETAPFLASVVEIFSPSCVIWIDYGGYTEDIVGQDRPKGSLRAYKNHQLIDDFLSQTGSCDLTYDVDFSMVEAVMRDLGYKVQRAQRQGAFLTFIPGFAELVTKRMEKDPNAALALKHLVMPGGFGDRFIVSVGTRIDK